MRSTIDWIKEGQAKHAADMRHLGEIQTHYHGYQFCFTVIDPTVCDEPLTIIIDPNNNELHVARPLSSLYPEFSKWHKIITEFEPGYGQDNRKLKRGISALLNFVTGNYLYDLDKKLGQEVTIVFDRDDEMGQHLMQHNQFFKWLQSIGRVGRSSIPFGASGPSITFVVTDEVLNMFTLFAGGFGKQCFELLEINRSFGKIGLRY